MIPIAFTEKEIAALIYALRIASINCHDSNEPEVAEILRKVQGTAITYKVRSV